MTAACGALPAYVERGGELVYRPPYDVVNVRLFAFSVQAAHDKLDEFCDISFRRPSNGAQNWRALSDHVLVVFADIPTLRCSEPPDSLLGSSSEREAAVWVPMFDICQGRVGWSIPFIYTTTDIAMAAGREVYGYPKQIGDVTVPRSGFAPAVLQVEALSLTRFGVDERAAEKLVMSAKALTTTGEQSPLEVDWRTPAEALASMLLLEVDPFAARPPEQSGEAARPRPSVAERLRSGECAFHPGDALVAVLLCEEFLVGRIPIFFLKQFRDAARGASACYQAIIEGPCTDIRFIRGGFLPQGYEVRFEELAGQPLRRELGVVTDWPRIAFWVDLSYRVPEGDILWEWRASSGPR